MDEMLLEVPPPAEPRTGPTVNQWRNRVKAMRVFLSPLPIGTVELLIQKGPTSTFFHKDGVYALVCLVCSNACA